MTDLIGAARTDLSEARSLLATAGLVTWSGPAAEAFHRRLDEEIGALSSLAASVDAIGPPQLSPWRLPFVGTLL